MLRGSLLILFVILIICNAQEQPFAREFPNSTIFVYHKERVLAPGCVVEIFTLNEPQPALVYDRKLISPIGNTGRYFFPENTIVTASCSGRGNMLMQPYAFDHPPAANLTCDTDGLFISPSWLSTTTTLGNVKCKNSLDWLEELEGSCASNRAVAIRAGIETPDPRRIDIYESCFLQGTSTVLYVTYFQSPENFISQDSTRIKFRADIRWFPGLTPNDLYKKETQRYNIRRVVGVEKAKFYFADPYTFLARGYLAAKADFVLSTEQRATFSHINCLPQWQRFNIGNWKTLEVNLRARISEGNFSTRIYTGGLGILQLTNSDNVAFDIYLSPEAKKIPVPLWFYKVVYDLLNKKATVFLGLNNPFVTTEEASNLVFCYNKCHESPDFQCLNWRDEQYSPISGFSICCDVNEFRTRVPGILPDFPVTGLFY